MKERKPDIATFSIRFAPDTNRNQMEDILKTNCCHVEIYNVRTASIGGKDFAVAVADICLCHQDELRGDDRVVYWEQMGDFTPKSCGGGKCGNC